MAGSSSRFYRAGYTRPKYELPIGEETLFALCLRSFERYFPTERFVFVCKQDVAAEAFVAGQCAQLGIADHLTVALAAPTRGQAESVLRGLQRAEFNGPESLLIFNIDTIRPDYTFPAAADLADGYLEVFEGAGDHWSFVKPASAFSRRVALTTEKKRISNLCCTGLYHFSRAADFVQVCSDAIEHYDEYQQAWGELYVAPLYNSLIDAGKCVVYHQTAAAHVHFSGTPQEYETLLERLRLSGAALF